ncbi:MAG: transporter substrate-binding domain-containing protein, partial [Rhodospirillaceae bacterium]|nr:transporter substrate-binding domain-containing protein [Rhodospirillaceae bacterium]
MGLIVVLCFEMIQNFTNLGCRRITISRIKSLILGIAVLIFLIFHLDDASAKTDELSVAYCVDCVPFEFQNEAGKPAGLIIDYWYAWSKKTGIKVKFIAAPWDETLKMAGSGAVDAHAGLFFNKERDKYLDYGVPLRKTDTHVFFHSSLTPTTNFRELSAYRIGVLEGDYVEGFLKERVPSGFIVGYPDYNAIIDALKSGELKVFAADTPTGLFHLKKAGLLADYAYVSDGPLYRNDWFVASKEGNSAIIKMINDGMALITDKQKTEIARRWIGETRDAGRDDSLIVAIDRSYPPFTFMNVQGQPAGLFIDLWRAWSKKSGHKVRFRPSNWTETLESLKAGEADIHSGLSYSDKRAEWIDFSSQIYQTASRIYHRNGDTVPADIGAFGNRTLAVWQGTFQESEIRRLFPKTELKAYPTSKAMVDALLRGDVDALIQEDLVMEAMLNDMGLQGRIVARAERLLISTIHAGVAKGKNALLKDLNASMALIAKSDIEKIETRWITNPDNRFYGNGMTDAEVGLTRRERAWLNSHPLIQLGSDGAWAPYEYLDKDGVLRGLSAAFLARIENILGIRFQPPKSYPWKETMARAKSGKIDVLSILVNTPERQKYFNFTKPFMIWPNVIAMRTDATAISGLEDLAGKRVGVVDGYAIQATLKRTNPDLVLVPQTTLAEALKALSEGRIDAFVDAPITINYFKDQLKLKNIAVVAQTSHNLEISIGVRKDWPELTQVLDKALEKITPAERRALAESVGLSVDVAITKMLAKEKDVLSSDERAALIGTILILVIFLLLFVWLFRTQRRPFFQSLRGKSIVFIVGVFVLVGGSTLWALSFVGDRIAVQLGNFVAER